MTRPWFDRRLPQSHPRRLRAALALALAAGLVWPGEARAQAPAGDAPPDQGSVPRGPGGAIIKPPAPPADTKPGEPTMPRALNYTPPDYPPEAKAKGLEGSVTLQLDINRAGKVINVVVVESAGNGFDESAVAAAKKLDFEPARRPDGTPFAARILYRYSFTLKTEEAPPPSPADKAAEEAKARIFKGTVLIADSDAAIPGATVTVRGPGVDQSIATGTDGVFSFERPKSGGPFKILIEAPGYDPLEVDESNDADEVKYRLSPKGGPLEVVIRGARPPREVTKRTLEQREISRIPGTNGDALRSIQSLPGVARPPGLAGLLLVRGSGPQDTQTFIDGTPVPLIYHFGGLSSVVPTELLEKIDFYPGNFSTQCGRVMGGIVDAGLRSPKDDGYHGLAQLDLIDARLMVEGPIPYLKGWKFAAAGRRSYVDAWLGPVLSAAGAGVTQAPVYYDYQFLVENKPTSDARFRLAFFGSDDALKILITQPQPGEPALAGNIGLHTAFQRLQARYTHDIGDSDRINAVVALGQDTIEFGLGTIFFILDSKSITGRFEYSHKFTRGVTLNTGLDVFAGYYNVNLRAPSPGRPGEPPNQPFSTRSIQEVQSNGWLGIPAAYVEMEIAPSARAKIVPGLRADLYSVTGEVVASPRVNGRFDIRPEFPRTTVKGGVGLFHQFPQFQETIEPLGNPNLTSNRAIHYALGFEQDITKQIELSAEGFYKQLDNLVRSQLSPAGTTLQYGNVGRGYVVGSEILLKYKPDARFFGWLAYTLSRSVRNDGPGTDYRLVNFDQTHILTVLGSYRLGGGWEFGARFRLISGNLITPNVCDPSSGECDPNRTGSLFHAPSGVYTAIPFGGPATERLPVFHQLDLRIDKKWQFKSWALSTYLDVQNVYNQGNAEGLQYNFNFTARQYVTGLPILPSIGIRGEF